MTDEERVGTPAEEKSPVVSERVDDMPGATPPGKSRKGLIIGILIAVALVACLIVFLYNKFFVPREIHMSENVLELNVGDTVRLSYTILPGSSDNLEVVWASSNADVATIDEFGVVTAVSGGRCAVAVATGNGKTDTCVVTVTDPAQIQKERLDTVVSYIESQPTSTEEAIEVLTVNEIDENHSFLIGTENDDLLLIYRTVGGLDEMGVDAEYSTYVRFAPENIDTAQVTQKNCVNLYDFPIEMNASGLMNLSSYQFGDSIALSSTGASVDGLDATDALHALADSGVTNCISGFSQFLLDQGFDFSLSDFGLSFFAELSGDGGENPETAKVGEPVDSEYSQVETVPVETENPDVSTVSDATEDMSGMAETEISSSETVPASEDAAGTDAVTDEADSLSGAAGISFTADTDDAEEDTTSSIFSKFPTAGPSAASLSSITEATESGTNGAPVLIIAIC